MENNFDYIIVGGGAMGAATACFLAKTGAKILLLEQFDFIHENGAHGGQTRLIRKAYFEHPDYIPLLLRAYENWAALEQETGEKVYYETGIQYFGAPGDPLLASVRASAAQYHLPLQALPTAAVKRQYPMFGGVPDHWENLFEPEAGFLLVEKCIQLYLQLALRHGACLKAREKVLSWAQQSEGVTVQTTKGSYRAQKLIFSAGAWSAKLMQELSLPLRVTRQILGWVRPENWEDFTLDRFVCWAIHDQEKGLYYGMPILKGEDSSGPLGLKLGCHTHGDVVDPDAVDRHISARDEATFRHCLETYMPAANGDVLAVKTCLYANSPDEHFIIDRHPQHDRVILACGFSGHGFKFASVVGEVLADLAVHGVTQQPVAFLGLGRLGQA